MQRPFKIYLKSPAKGFNPKLKRLLILNKLESPVWYVGLSPCLHLNIHELAFVYQQTLPHQ